MFEQAVRQERGEPTAENLRAKLARGDALAGTVQPILRHLLGNENAALFGDEILARIRGMAVHLAQQLLTGVAQDRSEVLTKALLDHPGLLTHLHALALEWQLAERLEDRLALDPVVPPLLQALIASPDPQSKDAGMKVLAAQAAWCQAQRRMQLPLLELPGDLLQAALLTLGSVVPPGAPIEAEVRAAYNEGASRLGLAARLVTGLGHAAVAVLDLRHAGLPLFLSALALGSGLERDRIVLATSEAQVLRLALALRAAGLSATAAQQQLAMLHPDLPLPGELAQVGPEQAAALLSRPTDAQA